MRFFFRKNLMTKTSLLTRLRRVFLLLRWLLSLSARFCYLDKVSLSDREAVMRHAALDALAILNVCFDAQRLPENLNEKGRLVVANHVSWLDVLVISAILPSGFIAMKEILSWPVIGKMVKNAGTVFIDRSNRKEVDLINEAIVAQLNTGANVCFFPEARTTLGNNILPLKAALFQAAINAQAAIQPFALRYYHDEQRTEKVSFHQVNLLRSLWHILSLPEIQVKVEVFSPFLPSSNDRFVIKDEVEVLLREVVLRDSPNPNRVVLSE